MRVCTFDLSCCYFANRVILSCRFALEAEYLRKYLERFIITLAYTIIIGWVFDLATALFGSGSDAVLNPSLNWHSNVANICRNRLRDDRVGRRVCWDGGVPNRAHYDAIARLTSWSFPSLPNSVVSIHVNLKYLLWLGAGVCGSKAQLRLVSYGECTVEVLIAIRFVGNVDLKLEDNIEYCQSRLTVGGNNPPRFSIPNM